MMTLAEIREKAYWAETHPGSGELNWGEVGWEALRDWVAMNPDQGLASCDVESVQRAFEHWWKEGR